MNAKEPMPAVSEDASAITLDVDWAPDWAIDHVAGLLVDRGVPATWFITHDCAALKTLRAHPELFELGIHPNFRPNSTQGDTPEAVLQTCMETVPEARAFRSHGLLQSTALLGCILATTPISCDVSLYLPGSASLSPVMYHWGANRLVRIPYFWQDDFEIKRPEPDWAADHLPLHVPGLKIFAFHPLHICLNSARREEYEAFKARCPDLTQADEKEMASFVQDGPGVRDYFLAVLERLQVRGDAACMRDIDREFRHRFEAAP